MAEGVESKQLKGWDRRQPLTSLIGEKITGIFSKRPPLKQRIEETIYRLNSIRNRLDEFINKLEHRDREYLEKCTGAYSVGDEARAKIYANECAEIRKIVKVVLGGQLALEQASLRLETLKEFGDTATAIMPVSKLLKSLKGRLKNVIPEVSSEIERVDQSLTDLLSEFGIAPIEEQSIQPLSREASKILKAASLLAEQRVKEKFPSLPFETGEPHSNPL